MDKVIKDCPIVSTNDTHSPNNNNNNKGEMTGEEEKGLGNCSISYGIFIKSSINFVKLCLKHKMLGFYGVLESIVVAKFNN